MEIHAGNRNREGKGRDLLRTPSGITLAVARFVAPISKMPAPTKVHPGCLFLFRRGRKGTGRKCHETVQSKSRRYSTSHCHLNCPIPGRSAHRTAPRCKCLPPPHSLIAPQSPRPQCPRQGSKRDASLHPWGGTARRPACAR